MVTERTLKRWRKDALQTNKYRISEDKSTMEITVSVIKEWQSRILCMTQELLDLHLIRK